MANILQRITSFFAEDVVAIYNASQSQVFEDARPMKASVSYYSRQFEHPLEDSTVITDHRVIMPVEISLVMTIPFGEYKDAYLNITNAFLRGDILQVRTKARTYLNMVIQAMPHEENPEKFDAIDIVLELKETQFFTTTVTTLSVDNVEDATQSSSVQRGEQNPQTDASIGAQAVDGITSFFGG